MSDYKANAVYKVDLSRLKVVDSIPIRSWTEGMIDHQGKLYVCGKSSDYLYKVDLATQQVEDSISVGSGPAGAVLDANDQLWILCEGNYGDSRPCSLVRLNLGDFSIDASFEFSAGRTVSNLIISADGLTLYFLNEGVCQMAISDTKLPVNPLIPELGQTFYGLATNYLNDELWISDAKDFISKSTILRYDASGNLLFKSEGGINARSFLFLY